MNPLTAAREVLALAEKATSDAEGFERYTIAVAGFVRDHLPALLARCEAGDRVIDPLRDDEGMLDVNRTVSRALAAYDALVKEQEK